MLPNAFGHLGYNRGMSNDPNGLYRQLFGQAAPLPESVDDLAEVPAFLRREPAMPPLVMPDLNTLRTQRDDGMQRPSVRAMARRALGVLASAAEALTPETAPARYSMPTKPAAEGDGDVVFPPRPAEDDDLEIPAFLRRGTTAG